jgi:hypothetical protein
MSSVIISSVETKNVATIKPKPVIPILIGSATFIGILIYVLKIKKEDMPTASAYSTPTVDIVGVPTYSTPTAPVYSTPTAPSITYDTKYKYLTTLEATVYNALYNYIVSRYNTTMQPNGVQQYVNALRSTALKSTNKSQLYNLTLYMATRSRGYPMDDTYYYRFDNIIGVETIPYLNNEEQVKFFEDIIDAVDRNNLNTAQIASIINAARTTVASTSQLYQNLPNIITQSKK